MRIAPIVVALAVVMAGSVLFAPRGRAADLPKLSVTIEAGITEAPEFVFRPDRIIVPYVPIILNVTVFNNGTAGEHTFTLRGDGAPVINVVLPTEGARGSVEFIVSASNKITVGGEEMDAELFVGGIKFYCVPHEALRMQGAIILGGVAAPERPEIGVFLRAYWIGIIGLVAMLVWTGIAYFIIKGQSRHHADHHEHVRRGLP